ncbi:MAG: DUF1934 domain-containing protein [Clostridia bacterium]|nr:DUF1934 domain-containing protein [Clostridia bacterium]
MADRLPVLVSVLATDAETGEEPMRVRMPGTLEDQSDCVVLRYTESLAEDGGVSAERTEVTLRAGADHAVMQRRGAFGAMMVFRPGETRESAYHTPYGDLPMAVRTRAVAFTRDADRGEIRLDYELSLKDGTFGRRLLTLTWQACRPC